MRSSACAERGGEEVEARELGDCMAERLRGPVGDDARSRLAERLSFGLAVLKGGHCALPLLAIHMYTTASRNGPV